MGYTCGTFTSARDRRLHGDQNGPHPGARYLLLIVQCYHKCRRTDFSRRHPRKPARRSRHHSPGRYHDHFPGRRPLHQAGQGDHAHIRWPRRHALHHASRSHFHVPPPLPECAPALITVGIPDDCGLIYIDDQLIAGDGTWRYLQSPALPPGASYLLHLRAAFKVGDNLLIEEKSILIHVGESITVKFDGQKAISVPLPREAERLPIPRELRK